MAGPVVSIERLRIEFPAMGGTTIAVRDVSFEVLPGEILCLVGESGSGKSVTSSSLLQLTRFTGGRMTGGSLTLARRNGRTLNLGEADEQTMRDIRGNEIGMVFQEPMIALNPSYTVGWQIAEGLRTHRDLSREAARDQSVELLRRVRIPDPDRILDQYPHELSGGMCQRVVIAMALSCEPSLLIADEPTTALDVTVQAEILALINMLRCETGASVLLITHDMAVVAQMADRVVVMFKGKIVEEGPVRDIILNPRHSYTRALLAAVPKIGDMAGSAAPAPVRLPDTEVQGPGRKLTAGKERLLDVRNLTKRYPIGGGFLQGTIARVHAVEDVSLSIRTNETLALVGESGSGKSTTGRCILRLEEPDSGEVVFRGADILALGRSAMREQRRHMQVIFQDSYGSLNPQIRLLDQVAVPIRNYRLDEGSAVEDRVAELFKRVGMARHMLRRYPSELSGGQRQRVAIARALAVNPDFIVADEAVSSLDVSTQARVLNLLMELQADLGLSYLFISHDMAVVERISHRVAVMYLGRIVEIGSRRAVFENPRHAYTRTLLGAVPRMDPDSRIGDQRVRARPQQSSIHPIGYEPPRNTYQEVETGHFLLMD